MSEKWTSGPWVSGTDGKHRAWIADLHNGVGVWTERRFDSGENYEWGDREADARLIAAAPDLVEALTDARERMVGSSPGMKALIAKTDAALAKARGETA